MTVKKRVFEIIEPAQGHDTASLIYDWFMIIVIFVSLVPLTFKESNHLFVMIDLITTTIFIVDYLVRWWTADLKFGSYIKYPFTGMASIDLLSILPSLIPVSVTFKILRVFRLGRTLRILRAVKSVKVFKTARYSDSMSIIEEVIRDSKGPLLAVTTLAIGYILISALIVFNIEANTFDNFFDAVYWATVSLTTVGYGDIYPVTLVGRIVAMISSFFGIAVVALTAGIITAGYMNAISKREDTKH